MTVLHDFNKFWEMMRREKGSKRPPLTEAQRRRSRRCRTRSFSPIRSPAKVLYANPGYAVRINELPQKGERRNAGVPVRAPAAGPSTATRFTWQEGDVLMWEDIGTIHNAVADYGPDEHRLIKRCQVMADRPAWAAQVSGICRAKATGPFAY